jgi:aldehyde:ferredoxin oxidoreductase
MYGWRGKILRVDLTTGKLTEEQLDMKAARDYVGGRGLGIYYLNREVDPQCDPLSPENMLIMAAGPLTGTQIGRAHV